MEIHRFEKLWFGLSLALVLALVASVAYGAVGAGVAMVDDSGGTVEVDDLENTEFADPGVRQVGDDEYEVYVVARQFLFEPGTQQPIRVPAGSTVTFYVTSPDVVHGFGVAGTNVNTMVVPGHVTELTVEFEPRDESKEYGIVCNEYCGPGHHTMEGRLVVVPQDEYEGGA